MASILDPLDCLCGSVLAVKAFHTQQEVLASGGGGVAELWVWFGVLVWVWFGVEVGCLLSICETLGSVLNTTNKSRWDCGEFNLLSSSWCF